MSRTGTIRILSASAGLLALGFGSAPSAAQQATAQDIERLMGVIAAQQQQLDAMRAELNALKTAQARPAPAPAPVAAAAPAAAAPPAPAPQTATVEADDREAQMVEEGFVFRDQSGRSLEISGQVNPAFNVVDDGISTEVFIVDNDTSNSRLRFDVDAPLGETSLGATVEVAVSPNNSFDVSQLTPDTDADYDVRKAEVTVRDDRYGRLWLGKGSVAADDVAEYDLSLVAGPIMYSGVADIAGGIIFTDGSDFINLGTEDDPDFLTVGGAFFNFDPGRIARVRYDLPMFGPTQASISYGQDDQWATAVTLGGDYGDWTGWEVGNFTILAAAGIYSDNTDGVDYTYAGSASVLHNPTGISLTVSGGGQAVDEGSDPYNLYAKLAYDTEFWAIGPTGFGIDYTDGKDIAGEGFDGHSFGLAAVQKIDRYNIDLYSQLRWYDLDSDSEPDLKDIVVGTFGTKFTF